MAFKTIDELKEMLTSAKTTTELIKVSNESRVSMERGIISNRQYCNLLDKISIKFGTIEKENK